MIIDYTLPSESSPQRFEARSDTIIFGRKPMPDQHVDIDLIADEYVSRLHARLTYENNEYWIEDLGSANGTWVNEKKITAKKRLAPNDKIKVGWTIIEILEKPAQSPPDPQPAPVFDTSTREIEDPEALMAELSLIPDLPVDTEEPQEPAATPSKPSPDADSPILLTNVRKPAAFMPDKDSTGDTPIVKPEPAQPAENIAKPEANLSKTAPKPKAFEPPPAEPEDIPASEGTIVDLADVTDRPDVLSCRSSTEDALAQSWRQLTAFNNLCQMLNAADTLDSLVQILVDHLQQAIPNAQRGAVLLPDEQGKLLLKAHWPPGKHSVSMTWIERAYHRREPFIWSAPEKKSSPEALMPQSAIFYKVQSAIYVPLLLGDQVLGVMYVDNFFMLNAFCATDLELMRAIANQVAMFVRDHVLRKDLQREEEIRTHLVRQFSPKIAERIFGKDHRLRIGGERVNPVTILVSDVRNFTALSSTMEPDDVVRMLNEMFDAFVPIIFDHDGVVDKYVGDSVLAVFGSPEKDDKQCEKAVRAALEMQQAVQKLKEGRRVRRLPTFDVGISIHTGAAIHGFIGSSERMEYTVIGDTVNQASRYCDGAGPGEVIISTTVYERIYHLVNVQTKMIRTKHPDLEPDLEAYIVKELKDKNS